MGQKFLDYNGYPEEKILKKMNFQRKNNSEEKTP